MALDVVAEAELRRRDAELRGLAAVAQVASKRDLHAAAQAVAVDHGERGLERVLDRVQHAVEEIIVLGYRAAVRAHVFEFRNIRAGGEGLAAGAAKGDAAHLGIAVEFGHRRRDRAPHGVVDGVLLFRPVEDDPTYRAALLDEDAHGLPAGP